jgi:hypothetical protein
LPYTLSKQVKTDLINILFFVTQQTKSGLGGFIVDVSRSYVTSRHTYLVGLKSSAVAEVTAYTKHNKHKGRISVPLAGFEFIVPSVERRRTYALDRSATGIILT